MWLIVLLLILCSPLNALAQSKHDSSNTTAVDDPYIYSPSWTTEDEDIIIKAYIDALGQNPRLRHHGRVFIWKFTDKTGELINIENFKTRLQRELSKAFPNKSFIFKGYGSLVLSGQMEMDVAEIDGTVHKKYNIWINAIDTDIPMKQLWSKKINITHSIMIPDYRVGFIEDAR